MSGKPAARQTDLTAYGGPIIHGSLTVWIGSQGGIACSVCPGGVAATKNPVNPQLGAKVLLGAEDLDFALPGALPVVWQRQYSSYVNAEHGAACGLLGHGWHLLTELSLELRPDALLLFDASGRVITFEEPLNPGQQQYSPSEDLWLLRGSADAAPLWSGQPRFAHISAELAQDPNAIIAASGSAGILWLFSPDPERSAHWRLSAQIDRFGRSQRHEYSAAGPASEPPRARKSQSDALPAGRLIAITDGIGRRYRLQHQRIHAGKDAQGLWGADDGWRLSAVLLERDPHHATAQPIALVRYGYDRCGQLITVHDRAGELARQFEWERRRISAHRVRGGPWHRYQYAGEEPALKVIAQTSEQGLDYRFDYISQEPGAEGIPRHATTVTDSLGRVETYQFQGAAGLSRLIEHQRADASILRYQYDGYGRQVAAIDPLGRTTWIRRDAQGKVTGVTQPGAIRSSQSFDQAGRLTETRDPTGALTKFQYDEHSRLIQIEQADGSLQRYGYPDPKEQINHCDSPNRIEDPKGGIKRLAYNEAGQLTSYTDCSGQSTHYRHDRWGEFIETTDAQNHVTRHERDAQGRIVATKLPNGQTARYQYNAQGQLIHAQSDENSAASALHINRDLWGRPIQTSQGGLTLQFEYDTAGRLTTLTNENSAQSRFAWDKMDRLVQEEGFDRRLQRYQWDAAGQLVQASDGSAAQSQSSHYLWDEAGRLIELRTPATGQQDSQARRYEWDSAGRLQAAGIYLIEQQEGRQPRERLQTRVELQRDALGRITAETQRVYKTQPGQPEIEYEHHIAHQFDPLGNRQSSQLQALGEIGWLLYGSGHVHGITHDKQSLIDFERDSLHRETRRHLHPAGAANDLTISRWRDSLGRLQGIRLENQLPQAANPIAPILIGQLTQRQYHYDALGQLIGIQNPHQALAYTYDDAGRLRAMRDSLNKTPATWEIDPAGNRLPGKAAGQQTAQDWAELVHRQWRQEQFNLLGQGQAANNQGEITRWSDNRIGFHEGSAWRYDACGNRIEQVSQQTSESYSRHKLGYDGNHQLAGLQVEGIDIQGNVSAVSHSSYVYDALGRRLKKTVKDNQGKEHITYFGWDGDRLVHTERLQEGGSKNIEHTVYEPGTFTPLIRLSAKSTGPLTKPPLMAQVLQATAGQQEENKALAQVRQTFKAMPEPMQRQIEQAMQQALKEGLPAAAMAALGEHAQKTTERLADIREQLQEQRQQEQTPVEIHFYHCDHLGTPIALTDRQGNIA